MPIHGTEYRTLNKNIRKNVGRLTMKGQTKNMQV